MTKPVPLLSITPSRTDPHRVTIAYRGYLKRHIISTGDARDVLTEPGASLLHSYPVAGTYLVIVRDYDTRRVVAAEQITILDTLTTPADVTGNPEWSREQETTITFPASVPRVGCPGRLTWPESGYPTRDEEIYIRPGATYMRMLRPGENQEIQIVDDGTGRTSSVTFDVPATVYDPDFTWRYLPAAEDPDGYTVEIELTSAQDKALTVYWISCANCPENPTVDHPKVGDTFRFTYEPGWLDRGWAAVQIGYVTGDAGHGQVHFIELPRPASTT